MHEDASTSTNIDRFAVGSALIYDASDVLHNTFAPTSASSIQQV